VWVVDRVGHHEATSGMLGVLAVSVFVNATPTPPTRAALLMSARITFVVPLPYVIPSAT
jgi:hypothetical protein